MRFSLIEVIGRKLLGGGGGGGGVGGGCKDTFRDILTLLKKAMCEDARWLRRGWWGRGGRGVIVWQGHSASAKLAASLSRALRATYGKF